MKYLLKTIFLLLLFSPTLFGLESSPLFVSEGYETQKITIGGHLAGLYQWIDLSDCIDGHSDPDEYNNFQIQHARLIINSELGCDWSGNMDVDISGSSGSDCECSSQAKVAIFNMYIQKIFCDSTFRFGYQKVQWGVEQNMPKQNIKAVERSIATNFFTSLGSRAYEGIERNYRYTGESFGGRHTGIFVNGSIEDFKYYASVVNGYSGICGNSTPLNNELGYYLGFAYDFKCECAKFTIGINSGVKPKGTNVNTSPDRTVYGFNPYFLVKYNRLDVLSEFFWASMEDSKITAPIGSACPWGLNIIPSYMLNDCWELVGRFSYVNSDERGLRVQQSFGCTPNTGFIKGTSTPTKVASDVLFEKAYATYLGVNHYMLNKAVRATLGLEQVRYVNRANALSVKNGLSFSGSGNQGAKLNVVRASLQLLF